MTTAAAGDHVSKTLSKPPAPKAAAASKPPVSKKPWAEQSLQERYGSKPKTASTPMNKQLKDVLRYLEHFQERGCISWEEIATDGIPEWYDRTEGGDLYNALISNPRVLATARGFAYQSEHGITDQAKLLGFIRSHPEGVKATEIKDGYESVLADADKLHAEGLVYKIYNGEWKQDVFFAVPQEHFHSIEQDLVEAYLRTDLPSDPHELMSGLDKLKLPSALANASALRKPIALLKQEKPRKKQRRFNREKMTNTHVAHILDENKYTSID